MSVRFSVDLVELERVVERMYRFQTRWEAALDHLGGTVAELHDTWVGQAALAQRTAHQEWTQGARFMHQALAEMTAAAQRAHDAYWCAAQTNVTMWADLT